MNKIKYPRTPHLPWSNWTKEDRVLKDVSCFDGKTLVITEKMDGECTSMTKDHIWARSLDSADHPSQHWVKGLWGTIKHLITEDMIICGENMFAKHSIQYNKLDSYFLVFNIWIGDTCCSWERTKEICQHLELTTVPVLVDYTPIPHFSKDYLGSEEGYVVRNRDAFQREDFIENVAKYVRPNHVQTAKHWKNQPIIKNNLAK